MHHRRRGRHGQAFHAQRPPVAPDVRLRRAVSERLHVDRGARILSCAGLGGQHSQRDLGRGRRPARLRRAVARRRHHRAEHRQPYSRAARWILRRAGHASGRHRNLWCHGAERRAAPPGSGHSPRARRQPSRCDAPDSGPRFSHRAHRNSRRRRRGGGCHAGARFDSLPRESKRPAHVLGCRGSLHACGAGGVLDSGAAQLTRRPDDRVALRMRQREHMISTLGQDLRFAARMLTKRPGFTLVAVLTLALSIGANTALFSVVQAVLLRPLPFHDPERLVDVWQTSPKHDVLQGQVSYPDFLDWKNQNRVFEGMAAYHETHGTTLSDAGDPLRLYGAIVSPGFFELLGVKPTLGGTFTSDVDIPGKSNVVILSARLWQSKFQSDPRVLGRSVTIAGKPYTVLGVMPRDFQFPILAESIDVWVPLAAYDGTMPSERGAGIYFAIARLKPGVSLAQASSQLNTMESRLAAQYPETHSLGDGANVALMLPDLVSGSRKSLLILFGAVAVVLLIACA